MKTKQIDQVITLVGMTHTPGNYFPAGSVAEIVEPATDECPGRLSIDGHEMTYWSNEVKAIEPRD